VLNAALSEMLRLQMNGLSPRTVLQDATVTAGEKTYAVQKGDTVFIVMASVHKNPDIYDEPYEFQLKRFMALHDKSGTDQYQSSTKFSTKSGAQIRNPFIWWGGGQHIVRTFLNVLKIFQCSGRKFAIGEILLFAATLLHQFELTSVTGDGPPNPPSPPSISRYGSGMEFPAVPWQVRMKYRTT
jgi:cytochrome P450